MVNHLSEGLLSEMNKAKDLIAKYNELPDSENSIKASLIKKDIEDAQKAISEGNIVQMLISFKRLKYNDLN